MMCTLLYATVPARADLLRMPETSLQLDAVENAAIQPRLREGEQLCAVHGAPQCGAGGYCGIVLGRASAVDEDASERRLQGQLRKLKKKGWSESKIASWLEQRRQESRKLNLQGTVAELAPWQSLLEAALDQARLKYLGLIVFASGDEDAIPFRCESVRRGECDLTRLAWGVLHRLQR